MREITGVIYCVTLILWPIAALAAGESLSSAFTSYSIADYLAVLLVSTVSGLVALIHRIRKDLESRALEAAGKSYDVSDRVLIDWRLFAAFHMTGSYMAGLIVFMLCEYMDYDSHLEAICIALGAWVGAKLMEVLAGGAMNRLLDVIGPPRDRWGGGYPGYRHPRPPGDGPYGPRYPSIENDPGDPPYQGPRD